MIFSNCRSKRLSQFKCTISVQWLELSLITNRSFSLSDNVHCCNEISLSISSLFSFEEIVLFHLFPVTHTIIFTQLVLFHEEAINQFNLEVNIGYFKICIFFCIRYTTVLQLFLINCRLTCTDTGTCMITFIYMPAHIYFLKL